MTIRFLPTFRTWELTVPPSSIDPVDQVGAYAGDVSMLTGDDKYEMVFSEIAGTPGFRYTFNFPSYRNPNRLLVSGRYVHRASDYKKWRIYRCDTATWIDIIDRSLVTDDHPETSLLTNDLREFIIPSVGQYTQNGIVKIRIEHYSDGGNTPDSFFLDCLLLSLS